MAEDPVVIVESLEDEIDEVESAPRDYLYIFEQAYIREIQISDWTLVDDAYEISIPYLTHGFIKPHEYQRKKISGDGTESNVLCAYTVDSNNNITIYADMPIHCRVLIKGEG